jgi:hypothetical protein
VDHFAVVAKTPLSRLLTWADDRGDLAAFLVLMDAQGV